MLTLFTTAKAFTGHSGIIQRNALKSWTLLHPEIEIILFGDDDGAADISRELGLRHEPHVERNEFGTKRIDWIFRRAQEIARHDLLCYSNCDMIYPRAFCEALETVRGKFDKFLMVGRRWDADITAPLDFSSARWEADVTALAQEKGIQQPGYSVDYFAFRRRLYLRMPELVIGRVWWDHWLVWKARMESAAVVDVSPLVIAIHQNHGYGYHPAGAKGVWTDEQATRNWNNAGGRWHLFTIDDATHILDENGTRRNWKAAFAPLNRYLTPRINPLWFRFLDLTRPLRHALGMKPAPPRPGGSRVAMRHSGDTQNVERTS
ncbi:MAG: hypothetical protein JSS69_06150 [Acidobacteria bacterium]|nr:hypothetical protein [Acidobacteriota bacterium]MBS1865484.1 hypothetical protein [Acidobacteriota bacterium]